MKLLQIRMTPHDVMAEVEPFAPVLALQLFVAELAATAAVSETAVGTTLESE